MVMSAARRDRQRDRLADEIHGLKDKIADLESEVKAMTEVRDRTAEVQRLGEQIEQLRLEKGRLTEEHAREVRETEHRVGLLRKQQDQELTHAKRMTELEVREGNLKAERDRFEKDMAFQHRQLQGEVDRIDGVLKAILERLPVIDVELTGGVGMKRKAGKDE